MDGARLSLPAMRRLLGLVGRTSHGCQIVARERSLTDGALICLVQREPGLRTVVRSPEGALTLMDLRVSIHAADQADGHGALSQ